MTAEQTADEMIGQYNATLAHPLDNMTPDERKSVSNAKTAILDCINQFGDHGWVALSAILADVQE